MSLKTFVEALPDYARDLRLNASSILNDQTLGEERKNGLLLACAHGSGHKPLVDAVEAEVAPRVCPALHLRRHLPRVHRRRPRRRPLQPVRLDQEFLRREIARPAVLDPRHPVRDGVFAVALSAAAYVVFARMLQLSLPAGVLAGWL